MLRKLREPRYAALGVLMLVVALVCIGCGIWQVHRFESKHDENRQLRANADRPVVAASALLPVVGGRAPSRDDVEFRQVRATGRYDVTQQTLVRNRTDGDDTGFLVVTPLRTGSATLLVVRGFLPQPASGGVPTPAAPPAGDVTVVARAQAPESKDDKRLADGQVLSINPTQQQPRLGGEVYDGYAQLEAGQPGTGGLRELPRPDLGNPAGGALEPQHFAYVIQWFLFAALALAAPFAMIRAETKRRDSSEVDAEPAAASPPLDPAEQRAAKLADRYGRPVR